MSHCTQGSALVLAAHGSTEPSGVHDLVRGYIDRLNQLPQFTEVSAAFHLGEPSFSTVLDLLHADRVIVVPLMTSRGYYSDVVLPKELAKNRRYPNVKLTITDPVGTHRDMPFVIGSRIRECMNRGGFDTGETTVILVGHGTPRHAQSSESTRQLANALKMTHPAWDISAGFLDGLPTIEAALAAAKYDHVVVEPFLIADGTHASRDIPRCLGMEALDRQSLPMTQRIGQRTIACDSAAGTDPAIINLITDLAVQSADRPQP